MKVNTTLKNIKINYPDAYLAMMKQIRSGKSKFKDLAPSKFKWSFDWAQQIQACSFQEILDGTAADDADNESSIPNAADLFVSVCATSPKGHKWYEFIKVVPREVWAIYEKNEVERKAELVRVDAMTPEEQEKEIDALLTELGGMGGFAAFSVPKGKS